MTNADEIRKMKDGELAAFLSDMVGGCPPGREPGMAICFEMRRKCKGCWLNWLKQKAE